MGKSDRVFPALGTKAPAFTLISNNDEKICLSSFAGRPVVLFFYPKDNTPGCTTEVQEFRDTLSHFQKLGIQVLGISPDSVTTHSKFAVKQSLNFPLLSDVEHKVAAKYGLWVEKKLYGRVYWGVQRATVLLDDKGKVARFWVKVKPKGHAADVLEAAREFLKGDKP